jgi:hypothetical protein
MDDSHRARTHVHDPDTESMPIATAAAIARAAGGSEPEAEVSSTACAQSLMVEMIVKTAATGADAMTAIGIMTATVTTKATTAADTATGVEIVDAQIMATRFMRNTTTSLNPTQAATVHLSFSVERRLRREGTTKWLLELEGRLP